MTQTLVKTIADFSTTLGAKVAVGATTATLNSATDSDGVSLPAGTYGFTIDRNNSSKEYFTATLSGTSLSSIKTITRGTGAGTAGFARAHRKGAEIVITDHVVIKRILNLLDGTTDFDSATPIKYDGVATLTPGSNQFATVAYVDAVSIAGAADATTTTKGIVEEATEAEINAGTAAGGTSARLFINPSTLATSNYGTRLPTSGEKSAIAGNNTDIAIGSGNKLMSQTGFQKNAEIYAASTTGNDTYVVTLSPVPTSLVNGMMIMFKPDTANTGAATLNVNSLGALSIVTGLNTALVTGDILANQVCVVVYNSTSTVWQLLNPASSYLFTPVYKNGNFSKDMSTTTTTTITHGFERTPKMFRIHWFASPLGAASSFAQVVGSGTYNGTTEYSSYILFTTNGSVSGAGQASKVVHYSYGGTSLDNNYNEGSCTWDGTDITITWSKTNSPTGTAYFTWEAVA